MQKSSYLLLGEYNNAIFELDSLINFNQAKVSLSQDYLSRLVALKAKFAKDHIIKSHNQYGTQNREALISELNTAYYVIYAKGTVIGKNTYLAQVSKVNLIIEKEVFPMVKISTNLYATSSNFKLEKALNGAAIRLQPAIELLSEASGKTPEIKGVTFEVRVGLAGIQSSLDTYSLPFPPTA